MKLVNEETKEMWSYLKHDDNDSNKTRKLHMSRPADKVDRLLKEVSALLMRHTSV